MEQAMSTITETPLAPFKRGQRIEYTYAGGKVVPGKVISIEKAARWRGWLVAELTDEHGSYRGCVHSGQCRSLDNRRAA
jgi:hypothetical protein